MRLIDADALIFELEEWKKNPNNDDSAVDLVNHFIGIIKAEPSADAVQGGRYENAMQKLREMPRCFNGVKAKQIKKISADRPTVVHCRECVRKKNCWMFDEHKDDNGTCVWAEPYYITESQNDVVEKNDEVIERPIIEHDREWIIGCVEHDGFIKTDRFDKANQIILDALSAEAVQGWIPFTRRPMTEEEQKDYPNCTFIFDCVLPDDGDEILVSNGRFVWMDTFCNDIDGCYLDSGDDIDEDMAWMPLPKPYKERNE